MSDPLASDFDDIPPRRAWALALLLAAALFAAVAPTLRWVEFTNGNENIVVQTALEMRHGGPALLPQLMGEPRVKKPPLVTWLTAASMRPATIDQLNDPKHRETAYHDLAFQARLPSLLAACIMLLATFEFARVWGGGRVGLCAAMAVATNYLCFKYMRQATTDAHLAAWVAVANACFVHGLLRNRLWIPAIGGGIATGLAFMCKGPVALVETVLPALVFFIVLRRARREPLRRENRSEKWAAIIAGVALFLLIAVPWFAHVWQNVPDVVATWKKEVGREGATNLEVSNPIVYLELPFFTAPWLIFGVVGALLLWQLRRARAAWVPAIFAIAPLLVMVWFRDRKERYMLPMIVPACTICGYGAAAWMRSWADRRSRSDVAVLAIHAIGVLGIGAALAVCGATVLKRVDGLPWFERPLAIGMGVAMVALLGNAAVLLRWRAWAVPVVTFVAMLAVTTVYFYGYRDSVPGRAPIKPLADAIRAKVPNAVVYDWLPRGRADEQIAVYLNQTVLRADPATLRPIDRPVVLITRQAVLKALDPHAGELEPLPELAANWMLLSTAMEGASKWSAYVYR